MSRFVSYDSDEERLPEGMTRVGYDADSQVYTFRDADGSYWESAPGCRYGQLTRVGCGSGPGYDDADTEPFLVSEAAQPEGVSWRHELMPLLNFGVLIGLCLLLFFWCLHWSASDEEAPAGAPGAAAAADCGADGVPYTIRAGDTCWALATARGVGVDEVLARNRGLDCDRLAVGAAVCLPA